MPDPNPSTLLSSRKSTFLTRQIRLLATPLTLSSDTSSTTLPNTLLQSVETKLNKRIASHNRLSFPLESQRHVLEQVEGVYWRDVLSRGLPVGRSETVVGRDVDFTGEEEVKGLGGWSDVVVDEFDGEELREEEGRTRKRRRAGEDRDASSHHNREEEEQGEDSVSASETISHSPSTQSQSQRYQALQSRLTTSIEHRDNLRQKLLALKRLKGKLEPFEDAQTQVQPNLMWKGNKEVEGEIARMRVLLVKCREVGRRGRGDDGIQEGVAGGQTETQTQTQRIESVLGLE